VENTKKREITIRHQMKTNYEELQSKNTDYIPGTEKT